jgi:hypothetical protein
LLEEIKRESIRERRRITRDRENYFVLEASRKKQFCQKIVFVVVFSYYLLIYLSYLHHHIKALKTPTYSSVVAYIRIINVRCVVGGVVYVKVIDLRTKVVVLVVSLLLREGRRVCARGERCCFEAAQ